jgi:hypothetical protein
MRLPSAGDHPFCFFGFSAQTEGKAGAENVEFAGPATKGLLLGEVALCARARIKRESVRMNVASVPTAQQCALLECSAGRLLHRSSNEVSRIHIGRNYELSTLLQS